MACAVSTTMSRVQNAGGLCITARRRRNLSTIKPGHWHSRDSPSKMRCSQSARRRSKLRASPVKVFDNPTPANVAEETKEKEAVTLPALLARPPPREVSDAAIAAVAPELMGIPAPYVRHVLQVVGSRYAWRHRMLVMFSC